MPGFLARCCTLSLAALTLLVACSGSSTSAPPAKARTASTPARIGHVFVLVLENKDFADAFGPNSLAPYLAQTLPAAGVLLENYYGVAHNSLPNYIAMISGQGPNVVTQVDCITFQDFVGLPPDPAQDGQALGQGCVYPASVPSLPIQLQTAGYRWKGYMEDMGDDPAREAATCAHAPLNQPDATHAATVNDQYAARHNPFVYFHAVIDDVAGCNARVVNLRELENDLKSVATTPHFSFITPDLCHDGHDSPCVNGEPGGLQSINDFLQTWVPRITSSPAFLEDGLLIVTFDEAESFASDASACCGEGPTPNTPLPGITGLGGGRVGAVLISPFIKPGTRSSTPYNHYSLLRSIEDLFGLPYLGYAGAAGQASFGADVYTARRPELPPRP